MSKKQKKVEIISWKRKSSPLGYRLSPSWILVPKFRKNVSYYRSKSHPLSGNPSSFPLSPIITNRDIIVSLFISSSFITLIMILLLSLLLPFPHKFAFSNISKKVDYFLIIKRGVKDIVKECAKNPHFHKKCKEFGENLAKSTVRVINNNKRGTEILEKNNMVREEGEKSINSPSVAE